MAALRHAATPKITKSGCRTRHYIEAALEHLLMWADHIAPFKFHPEQSVNFTLRPTYTLARAALESVAQAVWILSVRDVAECIHRHLRLIRWDLQEHRKSFLDAEGKERCRQREEELLARVDGVFTEKELQPPNGYLAVLQAACNADELDLDAAEVERLWRAASGAAHGMYWPNLELQTLNVGEEYEPGHFRARSFPDTAIMLDAMQAAHKMCTYAAMKYVLYAGADPAPLMQSAKRWLMDNVTLKPDADPAAQRVFLSDDPPDAIV